MNYVGNTIAIPIWYDHERIYVPSVDIPQGTWNLLWNLTPIVPTVIAGAREHFASPDDAHDIESIGHFQIPEAAKDRFFVRVQGMQAHQQGWLAIFENTLEKGDQPLPVQYSICISGFPCLHGEEGKRQPKKGKKSLRKVLAVGGSRIFDPVVIAQPDPIYP